MADITNKIERRYMRHQRVRKKVSGTESKPRLVVFKSSRHVYAQVVDDVKGVTLTGASTLSPEVRDLVKDKNRSEAAVEVGKLISKKLREKNVSQVVFDRNGYPYHGVVKSLAETVRSESLLA